MGPAFSVCCKKLAKLSHSIFYEISTRFTKFGIMTIFSYTPEPLTVELFLMPGCNLIQIASVIEPLRVANRVMGRQIYHWRLSSIDGAAVATTSGLPISVSGVFDPAMDETPLFVIASYRPLAAATPALVQSLSQARRYRQMIAGIESGSWLLAQAALLTERRATVHWEDGDAFASTFADIDVSSQHFVIDDNRATTAGSLPTLDMMLELIRQRQGFAIAMAVTRQFIYAPAAMTDLAVDGPAGFAAAMTLPGAQAGDKRLARVLEAMDANLASPLSVTALARMAAMSPRYLHKMFADRLGASPKQYYLALRHNAARRALIETGQPVLEIAEAAGFSSHAAFSTSYRTAYGETPSETRRTVGLAPH